MEFIRNKKFIVTKFVKLRLAYVNG